MAASVPAHIFSEIGLNLTAEETFNFVNLFNYVVDPPVKLPCPVLPEIESRTGSVSFDVVDQAMFLYRNIFRAFFCSGPYIDMAAAYNEAYSQLMKAVMHQNTSDEELTLLYFKMQTETHWIDRINVWRRAKFVESAMHDATVTLQLMIKDHFPSGGLRYFNEDDVFNTAAGMLQITVNTFAQEIPFFENQSMMQCWCDELHQRLAGVISEALVSNQSNMEQWMVKIQVAAEKYVGLLSDVLAKYPYLKQENVNELHHQAKAHAETYLGFNRAIWNNVMKSSWDSKINQEYEYLMAQWKSRGINRIDMFLNEMKAACTRISREYFNVDVLSIDGPQLVELCVEPEPKVWWSALENVTVAGRSDNGHLRD